MPLPCIVIYWWVYVIIITMSQWGDLPCAYNSWKLSVSYWLDSSAHMRTRCQNVCPHLDALPYAKSLGSQWKHVEWHKRVDSDSVIVCTSLQHLCEIKQSALLYVLILFTGARIVSTKKFSAFSGDVRTTVYDGTSRDHLCEQLPPVEQWGFSYYTVR